VSLDRQWLAVSVAVQYTGPFLGAARSSCVCVYSLEAQRTHAALPLPIDGAIASPVGAMTFTAASDKLLIVSHAKDAHIFDLESGARGWAATPAGDALGERLRNMPGHVCTVSADPARDLSAVLIHTPLALCHVNFFKPLSVAPTPGSAGALYKRRRMKDGPHPAGAGGANGRIIPLEHPALFAAYFNPGEALLIELPLDELERALPPPLSRPGFGRR
jgi:hypothetical protein